jgi:2-succinyl-6-hydroxy-2,4-cyclohexadiene-1-carboxylate synthase
MPRLRINQLHYNVERQAGPEGVAPLVLLHGFTGSAANWRGLQEALAPICPTIAIDLLGHGASAAPSDPTHYYLEHFASDFVAILDQLAIDRCCLLGYSLGGRAALHIALAAPTRLHGLILESASPGLADTSERAARVAADEQLAQQIERDGLAAFVDFWERLPLWESQKQLPNTVRQALRTQRLRNNPQGLAASLRGAGTGTQTALHTQLTTLRLPTLLIVGALDTKFSAIAAAMQATLPNAELAVVPNVGHTVHLEAPQRFAALIRDWK